MTPTIVQRLAIALAQIFPISPALAVVLAFLIMSAVVIGAVGVVVLLLFPNREE